MKFGTRVLVKRGGGAPGGQPGCSRTVRGILVGAFGHQVRVKLTQDDPLDMSGWSKKGDVGLWERSQVSKASP